MFTWFTKKRITRKDYDKAVRKVFRENGWAIGNTVLDKYCPHMAAIELLNRELFGERV